MGVHCPALYQWRLLALTLPTTTLFLSTAAAAIWPRRGQPWIRLTDTSEADDTSRRDSPHRIVDDLPDSSAFDDHVRLESHARDAAGVVGRAQRPNEIWLGSRFDPVQDVDVESFKPSDERCKKTNRSGACHEHVLRTQKLRWPTATTCSHAFVTTVVGSSSTPRRPSERSIFMA